MPKPVWQKRMELIFDEWQRQYAANPESFAEILDEDGNAVQGYGAGAARTFKRIADEMDDKGLLPGPVEDAPDAV